jgi:cob(I)alamin adenosyltransferase
VAYDESDEAAPSFEGLGQKHWKSDRVKDLERQERHAPRPGYVQVYTGDGKGKTTASLGLIVRAAGYGHRSCIVSFLKGDPNYGELRFLREHMTGIVDWHLAGRMNFVDPNDPDPADVEIARQGFETAKAAVAGGEYHVVVCDEINVAIGLGLVDLEAVLELLRTKPQHVEIVLTGRDAPEPIIEAADLVTEMRQVKHFYEAGIPARRGIEF